jgi:hypothetical protein
MTKGIKFPTLAVILLVIGIVWATDVLGYLNVDFPWLPVVLVIIAIGMIVNRYTR